MSPITIIAIIAGLVFVYVFGLFEGRGQGYKKRKAEEEQERKDNPPAPVASAAPVTVKVDDPGLMRIKNDNGYLTLDLDGVRVNTAALTADQRKRLIEMLNVIRPWLEGKSAAVPPPPVTTSMPSPPIPKPMPIASTPPPPTPRATPPTEAPTVSRSAAKEEPSRPAAIGIVGQIDAILQARLLGTPLEGRGIYLSNSPQGGVIVNVGLNKYNGIDEVTDPEIKAALRAAITEWEDKYTPGL